MLFSLPEHLEADAHELFGWLARDDHLRGRDRAAFVDGLTELYADLNALHPFRDGNGRTQRAFLGQLGRGRGPPDPLGGHGSRGEQRRVQGRPRGRRRRPARRSSTCSCTAADVAGYRHDTVGAVTEGDPLINLTTTRIGSAAVVTVEGELDLHTARTLMGTVDETLTTP